MSFENTLAGEVKLIKEELKKEHIAKDSLILVKE
jgi:hypothetical protein